MVSVGGGRGKQEVVANERSGLRMENVVPGLTHAPFLIGCPSAFLFYTPLPSCLHPWIPKELGQEKAWLKSTLRASLLEVPKHH